MEAASTKLCQNSDSGIRLPSQWAAHCDEADLRIGTFETIRVRLLSVTDEGFECLCAFALPIGAAVRLSFGRRSFFQACVVKQQGECLSASFSRAPTFRKLADCRTAGWLIAPEDPLTAQGNSLSKASEGQSAAGCDRAGRGYNRSVEAPT